MAGEGAVGSAVARCEQVGAVRRGPGRQVLLSRPLDRLRVDAKARKDLRGGAAVLGGQAVEELLVADVAVLFVRDQGVPRTADQATQAATAKSRQESMRKSSRARSHHPVLVQPAAKLAISSTSLAEYLMPEAFAYARE